MNFAASMAWTLRRSARCTEQPAREPRKKAAFGRLFYDRLKDKLIWASGEWDGSRRTGRPGALVEHPSDSVYNQYRIIGLRGRNCSKKESFYARFGKMSFTREL